MLKKSMLCSISVFEVLFKCFPKLTSKTVKIRQNVSVAKSLYLYNWTIDSKHYSY